MMVNGNGKDFFFQHGVLPIVVCTGVGNVVNMHGDGGEEEREMGWGS